MLTNTGGAQVTNVGISDTFNGLGGIGNPPQFVLTSSIGSCSQSNLTVSCSAPNLPGGQSWTVTVRGVVTAAGGSTLNNTVTGTATKSAQTFTVSATDTTLVNAPSGGSLPDLTPSLAAPSNVVVNTQFSYTITVSNIGAVGASNIPLVNTLPAGVAPVSTSPLSYSATNLFQCSFSAPSTFNCSGGSISAGASATITFNVLASTTGQITDTAVVNPNQTIQESNYSNNTAQITSTVTATGTTSPLTITVQANPSCPAPNPCSSSVISPATAGTVVPGATLTYTIVVTNPPTNGRADNVVVTDGTQGLAAASITATTTKGVCDVGAPKVTCYQTGPVLRLQPGESMTITISGQVVDPTGTSLVDTATVTANISNTGVSSSASATMTVLPMYELSTTLAASPTPVCSRSWPAPAPGTLCGGGLTYTIVVGNSGLYDATGNVVVRDPLPNDVLFDSFTLTNPSTSGFNCAVDTSTNVVTCSGGTVKGQSTATINLLVVPPASAGSITNSVTVNPNNVIPESDAGNDTDNTSTQTEQVNTGIDLVVSIADSASHSASSCVSAPQGCPANAISAKGFNPVALNGTETYVIRVDDIGPQDASGIAVQDTLPTGMTFVTASGDHGFTCSYSAPNVNCSGGHILGTASESYTSPIPYPGVTAKGADFATITIAALAVGTEGTMKSTVLVDPGNAIAEISKTNNSVTLDTTAQRGGANMGAVIDLTVSKAQTSPAGVVAPNGRLQYTITIGNDGTNSATGVEVTDTLPKGSRFIPGTQAATDISSHNFVCAPIPDSDPPQIDCTSGVVPPTTGFAIAPAVNGTPAVIQVTVFAPDTLGTWTNAAVVNPKNAIPEGNPFNNQNEVNTTVGQPDGTAADCLAKNCYNEFTISQAATPDGNFEDSTKTPPIDMAKYYVAPGGQVTKTISCNSNTFPDDHVCYTLTVANIGTDPATGIEVKDTIPAGSTFVSAGDVNGGAGAFSCTQAADGTIDCTGGSLSGQTTTLAGVPSSRLIQVVIVAPAQHDLHITNAAIVNPSKAIPEADYTNDSASVTTLVWSRVALTVSKTGPGSASQNSTITYTITVTNTCTGSDAGQPCADAQSVDVHDPLPVGIIPLTAYTDPSNALACQFSLQAGTVNVADCTGDIKAPDGNTNGSTRDIKISIEAFVAANDGTTLNNVATATSTTILSNAGNQSSTPVTTGVGAPDVTVYKSQGNTTVTPGGTQSFTITVANVGTAKASQNDVTVTDDFSASGPSGGFYAVSGTPTATNGFACTVASAVVTCTNSGADLNASANAVITINATVGTPDAAHTPLTNTATVADSDPGDTNTTDKSASVNANVGQALVDLAVASVTDAPDPVSPGQTLTYTITALNSGTQDATSVLVRNTLSSVTGITVAGASGSNGFSCASISGLNIDCAGNLPAGGGSTAIKIQLVISSTTPSTLTMTSTVDPNKTFSDPTLTDNTASQTTTVTTSGPCTSCKDLATEIFGSPDPVAGSGTISYSVVVSNDGDTPIEQTDVSKHAAVLDFINVDASLTSIANVKVTVSGSALTHAWQCYSYPASQISYPNAPNNHTLACDGDLAAGQGAVITFTATAPSGPNDVTTSTTASVTDGSTLFSTANLTDSVTVHVNS